MGFEARELAEKYVRQEGDTLETIAERETAAGNELTARDLARFNFGADDPDTVNECLRDELGCRKRDPNNDFAMAVDDVGRGELLIPQRFTRTGLPVDKVHILRVKKKGCPPQFLDCLCIPGITFEFDKSFVRPGVVDQIKMLEAAATRHPDAKVMIFGHTDKVGSEQYNKLLSERRAESVYAFIINDVDTWERLYNTERWGMRVIQLILQDFGPPYDPGRTDGIKDARTTAAIKQYQADRGLTVDGEAGPETRRQMFTEYMTGRHDVMLTPEKFMEPRHMGCGEFNPVDDVEGEHEPNRRVMFYLFHKDRLPELPCKHGSLVPCKRQMVELSPRHRPTFRCSFYDSISHKCLRENPFDILQIRLYDMSTEFIPEAPYQLTIANDQPIKGQADPQGIVTLPDTARSKHCVVDWGFPPEKPGETAELVFQSRLFLRVDEQTKDENEEATQKLNNLGYPPEYGFSENVAAFQEDYGDLEEPPLAVTGQLDDRTLALLRRVHKQCADDLHETTGDA